MGQMGLLVLGTLFAEGTVYRTLPGLRRELEASYSSRALLMSWRAFRTVAPGRSSAAAIDFQYLGVGVAVQLTISVSVSVSPVRF
jgi:hypothetical protein